VLQAFDILKEHGWAGLLLAAILFVLYKILNEVVAVVAERFRLKNIAKKQTQLSLHSLFVSMDYMLNVEVPSLNVFPDKPVRQALTRELIHASLSSMQEVAKRIISLDHSSWSDAEWTFQMRNALNEMNTLFLNKCVSKGIPEPVYMKYLEWYFERLNHMRSLVDQIAASNTSPTPESKTSTLLLLFSLFITTMMADCESAMAELNGEITGMAFRGGVIEPLAAH
jgi:hypothetical protein